MRSLIINGDKELFIKLHFEEVFRNFFVNDDNYRSRNTEIRFINDNKGIYQNVLHQDTVKYLSDTPVEIEEHTVYFLFDYIDGLEENSISLIADLATWYIEKNNTVVMSGVSDKYFKELKRGMEEHLSSREREHCIIIEDKDEVDAIREKVENTLNKIIEDKVKECCIPYNKQSPSSPVRLKYYISFKRMMEDRLFIWMAIYELALILVKEEVVQMGKCASNQNIILLATTMNGVTISSVLSQLLEVEVIKIDHLGPSSELYPNSFQRSIDRKREYLIISDVICMGREISDAKAVLKMNGAKSVGTVSIVNIVPVGRKPKDVHCLYNVDVNHNIIQYQIDTDLSTWDEKRTKKRAKKRIKNE